MKYCLEERIDIGRQVYTHELSRREAEDKYHISPKTIDLYCRDYRLANNIPAKRGSAPSESPMKKVKTNNDFDIEAYQSMTKEQLIDELIRAKVNEARAKKGYEVKGDGPNKVFSILNNKNSK